MKGFVLSWSEKILGTFVARTVQGLLFTVWNVVPVSLVTPATLSKDPTAEDIKSGTSAESS
jgi:hypothetical protein